MGNLTLYEMDIVALVEEIETRVENLPVRTAASFRGLRHEYSKRLQTIPAEDIVKISSSLIANRRVPRFIGDELVATRGAS
jgi:hypothetical protein